MLTAACTSLCNARADFGSDAETLSTDVSPNIDPGCGGGRSRTMVTASKAVCFPSGPAPTRHVWRQNDKAYEPCVWVISEQLQLKLDWIKSKDLLCNTYTPYGGRVLYHFEGQVKRNF